MITLSFLGGGWVTWTALDPIVSGAAGGNRRGALEQAPGPESAGADAAPAEPAPSAADALGTSPAPFVTDAEGADAAAARSAPSPGEQLQLNAVEGWRKLKDRASKSKWKKELTEGVEGTAEKWWSGVREALGAAPSDATPAVKPAPQPAKPVLPKPPADAPESQPALEGIPPAGGAGASGQIGDRNRQFGGRNARGWLQRLFQAP
ncbi:MAG: hypothetical protein EPO68_13625 [Planctomycetota bacterium]|nr:MAG: hypothetical protein EPO68_13625 [Planctomycetota bacterium]